MENKTILVTGASGYIASKLIPRLLDAGYRVRCMVRDVRKIAHQSWASKVELVSADVSKPETLASVLHQVDTAYYLIHNMSSGHGYQAIELEGAANFAQAAAQAGTKHIIYLGGLAEPTARIAPHLRSRIETGQVLRSYPVPVTEFRAGVIVGPGSISFEMIRFLCEQFPVLVGPAWLKNRTQPISAENVLDYLTAALDNHAGRGQVFEIGGPKIYTYGDTMLIYGQIRQLQRWLIILPALPTSLMAFVVDKLTPIPSAIAYPLIGGLNSNSTVTDPKAQQVFPEVKLAGYRQALEHSLAQLHPKNLDPIWANHKQDHVSLLSEGFLVESRQVHSPRPAAEIFADLEEWVNRTIDDFQLEESLAKRKLFIKEDPSSRGGRWLDWELLPHPASGTLVRQTSYYAPKGLLGFLAGIIWKYRQKQIFRKMKRDLLQG